MTSSRSRRRRERQRQQRQRRAALTAGIDDGRDITEVLQAADLPAWDGTTWEGAGIGLPDGVTAIAIKMHGAATEPIARLRAIPPPPPPPPPQQHVLAPVPVTEPAVIGDALRLPVIWCEAPACIGWYHDPNSAGFADARRRAIAAGWRHDAFGRLTCPDCQQRDPAFRVTAPAAWHHTEVARRWWGPCSPQQCFCGPGGHDAGENLDGHVKDRLAAEAECGRRISREDPALARAIAYATGRHEHRAGAS